MLLATGAAQAEGVGDAQRGFQLALKVCEECHIVAAGRKLSKPPLKGAPSFFKLADNPEITPFYLRAFFRTPHQRMPDFILKPGEQDDLIAYILSLRAKSQ
ncbi:MAG: c-type cytochrome [Alphaproteobacteria bacterium]